MTETFKNIIILRNINIKRETFISKLFFNVKIILLISNLISAIIVHSVLPFILV